MYVTDSILQERVLSELRWEPAVDAAEIGVTAHNHVITLQGTVGSYLEKITAERAARRLFGVRAVANEIEVAANGAHARSDSEIAAAALHALSWSLAVPQNAVTLTVERGFLRLHGDVEWDYQRQACEQAVRHLHGRRRALRPDHDHAERLRFGHRGADRACVRATRGAGCAPHPRHAAWAAAGVSGVDNGLVVSA